ncbi:uncharacterized protein K489DRAFT_409291 [Dissoconium aciculare CBS 342.82]|uniref:F-box domain-containing protein n=1 Tax=Dissoconium aciculare CBS 342.82 TaxID=1314786 RepID=A0A6J3M5V5_9PEZI|nr:uncharacterized protein K489DRAFT_409291 [Dissoconium aciculare CBS 342.82]KAF1823436.1 hypothetical protein K489DRAFT_409291 [Dissoconium aciculare CBS 342.82]
MAAKKTATKRKAEADTLAYPVTRSQQKKRAKAMTAGGSRLLDLPRELRYLILNFVFQDEAPILAGDILESGTRVRDPKVASVCRTIRAEALPLFYSSKAFVFNITKFGQLATIKRWFARNKTTPSKVQNMRKVTFFGRSYRGQVYLTIDFKQVKIIDARWRAHQRSLRKKPTEVPPHWHMGACHVKHFQDAMDTGLQQEQTNGPSPALVAMESILEACSRFFWIRDSRRAMTYAVESCRLEST